jgi:uncharacterized protein YkwD
LRYALAILTAAVFAVAVSAATLGTTEAQAERSYDGDVRACNGKDVYLKPAEKRTLQLHNKARANRGIPRLCIQQQLQRAARKHSADMIRNDYFSHRSQDGTTFAQRIKREGYTAKGMSVYRIGENIAGGSGSYGMPGRIHKAWMNSDGHRKNILKKGFRQVGIGVTSGKYKSYEGYRTYTVDFGFRRG